MPFEKGKIPEGAVLFQPGQTGNPLGHPKGQKNRSTIARKVLEMRAIFPDAIFEDLKTRYPQIAKTMTVEEIGAIVQAHRMCAEGDTNAYKALHDSAYGAPKQETDTTVTLVGFKVRDVLKFKDDNTESEV